MWAVEKKQAESKKTPKATPPPVVSVAPANIGLALQLYSDDAAPIADSALSLAGADTTAPDTAEHAPYGVVVEDGVPAGDGQIHRSAFLDRVSAVIEKAADQELAAVGRTTRDCPYLEHWLNFYRGQSAIRIEQAIQRYANPSDSDLAGLEAALVRRAREAVQAWIRSGGRDIQAPEAASQPDPVVQRKAMGSPTADPAGPREVQSRLGAGHSLDTDVRARMEDSFGRSFAGVRLHTDLGAAQLARSMSARAFTVGRDIGFAGGQYHPGTIAGDLLIAHELAHVVQQEHAGASSDARIPAAEEQLLEWDADRSALAAVVRQPPGNDLLAGHEWAHATFRDAEREQLLQDARPGLRSGLQIRRCNDDTPQIAPAPPTPKPAPKPKPPPPQKRLLDQFQTGPKRQAAVDKVVSEMSGKIDTKLLEDGKMFFRGDMPEGEGTTFPPGDKDVKRRHGKRNTKPLVEIYPAAFGDGWPLLRTTIWHEYQHVLQMSRSKSILIPGRHTAGAAQEVEAYCREILLAEEEKLHLESNILIAERVRKGAPSVPKEVSGKYYVEHVLWRRLSNYWSKIQGPGHKGQRAKLSPLLSDAKKAAERMVGHSL